MLYEKKPVPKQYIVSQPLVIVTIMLCAQVALAVLTTKFPTSFWDFKLVDIVNAVAQIATAAAFFLGFHQYKKTKEKERQNILSAECKAIAVRIIECIDRMPTKASLGPKTLDPVITRMGNLGSDFYELFSAMDEDVSKGIVRMYWQDMHLNHLTPCLKNISIHNFLLSADVPVEYFALASNDTRVMSYYSGIPDDELRSKMAIGIVNHDLVCNKLMVLDWAWLDSFQSTFYDDKKNKDYFWNLMNEQNMKYQAPFIYALYDLRFRKLHPSSQ